jgi:SAM-dependent methyltransferase
MGQDLASAFYERHHAGETGFRRYGFTIGEKERAAWFGRHIGRGLRLLDIGCRDGTFTSYFAEGNEVVGLDLDRNALAEASARHGIQTQAINLNNERLPFADRSFDAVLAGEVIEHLQLPELVVAEIHRVLRPGGVFCGSVPNAFRLFNRLQFLRGRDFEDDPTHLHHFSPDSVRKLLGGFRSVEVDFLASRHLWLSRRLMGTVLVWAARA